VVRLLGHQAAVEAEGEARAPGVSGVRASFIAELQAPMADGDRAVKACLVASNGSHEVAWARRKEKTGPCPGRDLWPALPPLSGTGRVGD